MDSPLLVRREWVKFCVPESSVFPQRDFVVVSSVFILEEAIL